MNVKRITDEHGTRAHFSGAQHCGNVWACPTCAPIVRRFRADEIAEGARRVVAMGGGMAMATFTIRHDRPDTLRDSFDLLRDAYADMSRTRAFRDWKSRSGLVGYIVAQEVTYGRFGWHPHRHVLFVFNHAVSEAEAEVFEAELFGMWAHAVGRSGGRTVSREAFDVRAVTAGNEQVAAYVTKVEKGVEGIGRELSLSDVKSGRAVGSVAPFQLLDIATPEAEELWCEYADATRGRSAIRWSRGLRARLGMDVEKSDEQVVDEAEAVGQVSIMIASDLYEARVSRSRAAALSILEAVEAGDLGAVGEILGGVAVPVELPGGTRAIAFYARLPEAA